MTGTDLGMAYNPFHLPTQEYPYEIYRRLRDDAPVYHNEQVGFWALTRYDDVLAAHLDSYTFSNKYGTTIEQRGAHLPTLLTLDPPEHGWYRRVVSRSFTPRRIADLEQWIRDAATTILDGAREAGRLDIVGDFSSQLPMMVISELLGIPLEYRDTVKSLADRALGSQESEVAVMPEDANNALAEYIALLMQLIGEKRENPGDDILSMMIRTELTDDTGNSFIPDDLSTAARLLELSLAGHETVAKLIGSGVVALAWSPDQRRELVDDPSLIPGAVEEMLRWDPPSQYQGRWTSRDVEIHGTVIPAETRVLLVSGAANHDERVFDDPGLFKIRRNTDRHVTFGWGIHLCLGTHLARLESRIAFEELLQRYPDYELDESGVVRAYSTNVRGLKNLPIVLNAA